MRTVTIQLEAGDEELEVDDDRPQTPVHSPGDALEAHLRMCQWMATAGANRMFYNLYRRGAPDGDPAVQDKADVQRAIFTAALDSAETIYVSPDMSRLTEALAEEQGEHVPVLHLTDVPMTSGLIVLGGHGAHLPYLGAPDDGVDDYGLKEFERARGFLFRLCRPGGFNVQVGKTVYTLEPETPDSPMKRLLDNGGLMLWELADAGQYLIGPNAWQDYGRPPFMPNLTCAYGFDVEEPWREMHSGPRSRRFVGSLFRLMWQRILAPEPWYPNRQLARRMQRQRPSYLDGEAVKVTHLRRYEPGWETEAEATGERGPMQYTVIVKGHWRDQWYPSLGPARTDEGDWNDASHRRIWIDAHFRGDGPLLEKHSITAVVR